MNMFNIMCYVVLIMLISFTNAQVLQTCQCVNNTCYQNLITDGSGQIDIRIVNNGQPAVTLPPVTTSKPTINCAPGSQICCTGAGVTGCGIRWNIPITPTTTAAPGQARYGSQPWAVVILGTDNSTIGGGVLISPSNVLTVAHKVVNSDSIKIRLGDWDANHPVGPYTLRRNVLWHPQFGPQNLTNDIAILHLTSPILPEPIPSPATNTGCLPKATSSIIHMRFIIIICISKIINSPF